MQAPGLGRQLPLQALELEQLVPKQSHGFRIGFAPGHFQQLPAFLGQYLGFFDLAGEKAMQFAFSRGQGLFEQVKLVGHGVIPWLCPGNCRAGQR